MIASMVALFQMLAWVLRLEAGVTTIPSTARETNICVALGADEGCEWIEVAHLAGDVTLVAYDPPIPNQPLNPLLVVARIKGREIAIPLGPASEQGVRTMVDNSRTNYVDLLVSSVAWPALLELAHIDEGVAIVLDARKSLSPKQTRASPDEAATTRTLRVHIAIVQLL